MDDRTRPPATVIVATHDRPQMLAGCVDAILEACAPADEVIVAASGEIPLDLPRPKVRVITLVDRRKDAKVNIAAALARNSVLVLTDDDCRVAPGWVDGMAASFTDPGVGVAFGPVHGLTEVPGGQEAAVLPPGPAPQENWAYAHGASMAVRRAALLDIGGFDERLGPGASAAGEEADVVVRMAGRGWRCVIADAPATRHVDWRNESQETANRMTYERGAGVWLGAGIRRAPASVAKLTLLRLRYQVELYGDRRTRGMGFGPRTSLAFAMGLAEGLRMRPRRFVPAVTPTARRPQVLWVTDEPPDLDLGGGNIRQHHLVRAFCQRADTSLLMVGELRDPGIRSTATEVVELPRRPTWAPTTKTARRALDLWMAFGHRGPEQVFRAGRARQAMIRDLRRLEATADLVIVNHHGLEPLVTTRRTSRWIFHPHFAAAAQVAQELTTIGGRRQRIVAGRQWNKAARLERGAASDYDGLIVVAEDDADAIAALCGGDLAVPVWVAPNGVDVGRYTPTPIPLEHRIMFTASLGYLPNVDGAHWFCDEVLPRVQAQLPDATLDLVGRGPVPSILALADRAGVTVHADVPSMPEWLSRCRVAVVPLRIGTGSRIKALEAMAAGRPVVGTSTGLAGLGIVAGTHALCADEPEALAQAIVAVLRSDDLANRLAAEGRRLVETRFRWDQIAGDLADAVLQTVAPGHPSF